MDEHVAAARVRYVYVAAWPRAVLFGATPNQTKRKTSGTRAAVCFAPPRPPEINLSPNGLIAAATTASHSTLHSHSAPAVSGEKPTLLQQPTCMQIAEIDELASYIIE